MSVSSLLLTSSASSSKKVRPSIPGRAFPQSGVSSYPVGCWSRADVAAALSLVSFPISSEQSSVLAPLVVPLGASVQLYMVPFSAATFTPSSKTPSSRSLDFCLMVLTFDAASVIEAPTGFISVLLGSEVSGPIMVYVGTDRQHVLTGEVSPSFVSALSYSRNSLCRVPHRVAEPEGFPWKYVTIDSSPFSFHDNVAQVVLTLPFDLAQRIDRSQPCDFAGYRATYCDLLPHEEGMYLPAVESFRHYLKERPHLFPVGSLDRALIHLLRLHDYECAFKLVSDDFPLRPSDYDHILFDRLSIYWPPLAFSQALDFIRIPEAQAHKEKESKRTWVVPRWTSATRTSLVPWAETSGLSLDSVKRLLNLSSDWLSTLDRLGRTHGYLLSVQGSSLVWSPRRKRRSSHAPTARVRPQLAPSSLPDPDDVLVALSQRQLRSRARAIANQSAVAQWGLNHYHVLDPQITDAIRRLSMSASFASMSVDSARDAIVKAVGAAPTAIAETMMAAVARLAQLASIAASSYQLYSDGHEGLAATLVATYFAREFSSGQVALSASVKGLFQWVRSTASGALKDPAVAVAQADFFPDLRPVVVWLTNNLNVLDPRQAMAFNQRFQAVQRMSGVLQTIYGVFEALWSFVYEYFMGQPFLNDENYQLHQSLQDVITRYNHLISAGTVSQRFSSESGLVLLVRTLKADTDVLRARLLNRTFPPRYLVSFNAISVRIDEIYQYAIEYDKGARARPQPLGIWLHGRPGTGKSTAMPLILAGIHQCRLADGEVLPEFASNLTYNYNPKDRFMSGYAAQPYMQSDDALATRIPEDRNAEAVDYIKFISTAPCPLNMASLEEKGSTVFQSAVVIACSNEEANPTRLALTDPSAFYRRWVVNAELIAPSDYQVGGAYRLPDISEFSAKDLAVWSFKVEGLKNPLNFQDFVLHCYRHFKRLRLVTGHIDAALKKGMMAELFPKAQGWRTWPVCRTLVSWPHSYRRLLLKPLVEALVMDDLDAQGMYAPTTLQVRAAVAAFSRDKIIQLLTHVSAFLGSEVASLLSLPHGQFFDYLPLAFDPQSDSLVELQETQIRRSLVLALADPIFVDYLTNFWFFVPPVSAFPANLQRALTLMADCCRYAMPSSVTHYPPHEQRHLLVPGLNQPYAPAGLFEFAQRSVPTLWELSAYYAVGFALGSAASYILSAVTARATKMFSGVVLTERQKDALTALEKLDAAKAITAGSSTEDVTTVLGQVDTHLAALSQADYTPERMEKYLHQVDTVNPKVKARRAPESAYAQGQQVDLLAPYFHNLARLTIETVSGAITANAFSPGGRILITTRHVFPLHKDSYDVKVGFMDTAPLPFTLRATDLFFPNLPTESKSDVVAFRLPKNLFTNRRKITQHALDESHSLVGYEGGIAQLSLSKEMRPVIREMELHFSQVGVTYNADEGQKWHSQVMMMKGPRTYPGDCGSLYIILNPAYQKRLVAMHVAWSVDYVMAIPITAQVLAQIDTHLCIGPGLVDAPGVAEVISQAALTVPVKVNGRLVLGKTANKVHMPSTSKLHPSLLWDLGFTSPMRPVHLLPFQNAAGIRISPLQLALSKYDQPKIEPSPLFLERVSRAAEIVCHIQFGNLRHHDLRFWTLEEAVNGVFAKPHAHAMSMKTSAGSLWRTPSRRSKSDWFVGSPTAYSIDPILKAAVEEQLQVLIAGGSISTLNDDYLKDELRDPARVEAGKTRLFTCPQLDHFLVGKMVTGAWVAIMEEYSTTRISCIGIDPHSPQWKAFYLSLISGLTDPAFMNGDFSAADFTERDFLFSTVTSALVKCLKALAPDVPWEANEGFMESIYKSLHRYYDELYSVTDGNSTGNVITGPINTLNFATVHITNFIIALTRAGFQPNPLMWHNSCSMRIYGDDSLVAVTSEMQPYFNMHVMRELCTSEWGMDYTTPDKNADMPLFYAEKDVSFLRRSFRHEGPHVFAPLELSSIERSLAWTAETKREKAVLVSTIMSAMAEYFQHGRLVFEQQLLRIQHALATLNLPPYPYCYDDLYTLYVSKY